MTYGSVNAHTYTHMYMDTGISMSENLVGNNTLANYDLIFNHSFLIIDNLLI